MYELVKIAKDTALTKRCRGCGEFRCVWKWVGKAGYMCDECTMVCKGCDKRVERGMGWLCGECDYEMKEGMEVA